MDQSDFPVKTISDTAKSCEMDVSSPSSQSVDKESSVDNRGRSSRRKPMKTHKVSANFEEVDHYDDYLKDGIPAALLEGLGFNQEGDHDTGSDSPSYTEYDVDDDRMHDDSSMVANYSGVRGGHTGGKRRGRPPGRAGSRGTPVQPVVVQPIATPPVARRRGRPPKSVTPVRVQPTRVMPQSPVRTTVQPSHSTVKQKQTPYQYKQQSDVSATHNAVRQVNPAASRAQLAVPHVLSSSDQACISNAAALSILPVTEFNVWPVLEKLLAATQSMGMLLGSLKDDLKRTSAMIAASSVGSPGTEHSRKRREVSTKLWRAFVAYKKSFDEIESFTRNTSSSNGSAGSQSVVTGISRNLIPTIQNPHLTPIIPKTPTTPNSTQKKATPQSTPAMQSVRVTPPVKTIVASVKIEGQPSSTAGRRRPRPVNSNVVIELSDSDEEDKSPVTKQCKVEVGSSNVAQSDLPASPNIETTIVPKKERQNESDKSKLPEDSELLTTGDEQQIKIAVTNVSKDDKKKDQQHESEVSKLREDSELLTTSDEQQINVASRDALTTDEENVNEAKTAVETVNEEPDTKLQTVSATVQIHLQAADERLNGVSEVNVDAKATSSNEHSSNSCTDVELDAVSETAENVTSTNSEPKSSSATKTELFSSLRFEPLFEIQPLNGSKS